MISRERWLELKRGDLLKCGRNVRKIHSVTVIGDKRNGKYATYLFVVLRKIRSSWTDPYPFTTYLWADLRWTHSIVRR